MPRVTRYIYVMQRVRKAHQGKLILDDVTLAFLPGAKIGVVGPNGAGKSTVLEIMAGLETISNGEAALAPGATVGILLQEPRLDPAKDVLGNVEEGVAATRGLLRRFEELGQRLGEAGPEEMDRLLDEYAKVQDDIEAAGAWEPSSQVTGGLPFRLDVLVAWTGEAGPRRAVDEDACGALAPEQAGSSVARVRWRWRSCAVTARARRGRNRTSDEPKRRRYRTRPDGPRTANRAPEPLQGRPASARPRHTPRTSKPWSGSSPEEVEMDTAPGPRKRLKRG